MDTPTIPPSGPDSTVISMKDWRWARRDDRDKDAEWAEAVDKLQKLHELAGPETWAMVRTHLYVWLEAAERGHRP